MMSPGVGALHFWSFALQMIPWASGSCGALAEILGEKASPEFRFRRRGRPDLRDLGQIPFRGLAPMGADEARHEIPWQAGPSASARIG
jgi:hypothetical protein